MNIQHMTLRGKVDKSFNVVCQYKKITIIAVIQLTKLN